MKAVAFGGTDLNPGVIVRVTSKGLWKFQRMLQSAIVATMKASKPRSVFDAVLNDRIVNFTEIHVDTISTPVKMDIRYVPDFQAPIAMTITDLNMKMAMKAQMNFKKAKTGDFSVELKNLNLDTGGRLTHDGQGHLQVVMTRCAMRIKRVKFQFTSCKLVLVNTKNMHHTIHRILVQKICPNIQVNGMARLNSELRKLPTMIKLFQPYRDDPISSHASASRTYVDRVIDLGLMSDPVMHFNPPMIDLPLKGDLLPASQSMVSVTHRPLNLQQFNPAKDINVFVSDQLISSLYRSFYSSGLVRRTRLEKGFMKFCKQAGRECIGKINEALAKTYRGQSLIFKMKPSSVPSVTIQNAMAKFHDQYTVTLFTTKDRKVLLSGTINADVTSDFSGSYDPRISNFRFKPQSNALKFTPEEMKSVTEAVRNTYQEFISAMFRQSFALPRFPFFDILHLQTAPMPNGIHFNFDVRYSGAAISPIMTNVFNDIITF